MPDLIAGLAAKDAPRRFGSAKALCLLSQQRPALLYPHFDFFAGLLDHANKVFQWQAIRVLAGLVAVDAEDRFAGIFAKYFSPIAGPVMITASNVIKESPRIVRARPALADRIAVELLKVSRAAYATPECRNVAVGHALIALAEFFAELADPAPVLRFAQRELKNPRPATRKKAEAFLRQAAKKNVA